MATYFNSKTNTETYACETCWGKMEAWDHKYCDICPECLDE